MSSLPALPAVLLLLLLLALLALHDRAETLVGVLSDAPQVQAIEGIADGVARVGGR